MNEPPNDLAVKVEVLALLLIMLIRPSVLFRHEEGVLARDGVEEVSHKAAYHNVRTTSLATTGWNGIKNMQIKYGKIRQNSCAAQITTHAIQSEEMQTKRRRSTT